MTPTQQARADVLAADGGCVAKVVDPQGAGPCHHQYAEVCPQVRCGNDRSGGPWRHVLEVDRVRDDPAMGKAPSHTDRSRMVSLCPGHHRGVGAQAGHQWATAHRPELRVYLAARNNLLGWSDSGERDG